MDTSHIAPPSGSDLQSSYTDYGYQDEVGMRVRIRAMLLPLRRNWWLVLPFVAMGVLYQYYKVVNEPTLYVSDGEMMLMGQLNIPDNKFYQDVYLNFFGTQPLLMESEEIKKRARERVAALHPDYVHPHPRVDLSARNPEETTLFLLTATGEEPQYTQYFLDAAMEAYLNFRKESRSSRTEVTLSQINAELVRLDKEIQKNEEELQDFRSRNNLVFIREQASNAASQLVGLSTELATLQNELQLIDLFSEEKDKLTQDGEALGPALDFGNFSLEKLAGKNTEYSQAAQRLRFLEAEKARFSKVLRPEHPKMRRFDEAIEQLNVILKVYERQSDQTIANRKRSLVIQIENLEETIDRQKRESEELTSKLADYEHISSRLERLKKLYDQKLTSLRGIDSARNISLEDIEIIKNATVARARRPDMITELVNGGMLGLCFGFGVIFMVVRWNATIYTEYDLPTGKDYRIISYIPKITSRSAVKLLNPDDTRYAFIEAFRNLRSYVLIEHPVDEHQRTRVVSITSAVPSEGKSTVSSNLALSLSFSSKRVLLIDADLRQGTQHRAFGLSNEKGLTDILEGRVSPSDAIQNVRQDFLDIIPRGNAMMNSSELLLTRYCRELFEYARAHYDYIIIDTPPVLATDDMANLLSHIDAVFVVARQSLSTSKSILNTVQMLETRHAPLSGFILNSCERYSTEYYRYKYYGKYGRPSHH